MKRLFYPDRSYSWLQFPVRLKRLPQERHPHMTLKFFGEASIDPYAIEARIAADVHQSLKAEDFAWEPRFWSSPFDHRNYHVLAFTKYPTILDFMHKLFDVIKDQYIPWTPHITVPKDYYLLVEDQAFSPAECGLEFGEIEICLGGPNI